MRQPIRAIRALGQRALNGRSPRSCVSPLCAVLAFGLGLSTAGLTSPALAVPIPVLSPFSSVAAPAIPVPKPSLANPQTPQQIASVAGTPTPPGEGATNAAQALAIPAADLAVLELAFQTINKREYDDAPRYLPLLKSDLARDLVIWRLAALGRGDLPFETIIGVLNRNPDWPRRSRLLAEAERAMDGSLTADEVTVWFSGREPITGEGKLRLGVALLDKGEREFGRAWIRRAWIEHDFSKDERQRILASLSNQLNRDTHTARLERLLWDRKYTLASELYPQLTAAERDYAEARIALVRGNKDPKVADGTLPRRYRNSEGLLFDRVFAIRRFGEDEDTWPLLLSAIQDDKVTAPYAEQWWRERHLQARKAHRAGDYQTAYLLAAETKLTRGVSFAEAEFFAGWIALRYLNKPATAQTHFQTLRDGVSTPISKARAHYWLGRALEAQNQTEAAQSAFAAGAALPFTYYGQLAALHPLVNERALALPAILVDRDSHQAGFEALPSVQVIRLVHALEQTTILRQFFFHLGDSFERPEDLALLGDLARELGHPNLAVRVGKKAMGRGILLAEHAYPVVPWPNHQGAGPAPELALVYGLSRQESEFNPLAVSRAGARGLMQLMPGTARITARKHNLPYSRARLTSDPDYNAIIGMAHMTDLLEQFQGSYIMVTAAYNAGGGRVDQWIGDYGDPRLPGTDPIDWVESIPFRETRNYVQRVLENVQVYRTRMAGTPQPLLLEADLRRFVPRVTLSSGSGDDS